MRVRGENVSAWEVERVMALHPAVESVAAVGVTSDIGEQEILLYVQFRELSSDAFAELAQWAQSRLASFQLPRYYRSVERFELTPSERIRKHLLSRDLAAAWDLTRGTVVAT
jgi:crotonobetaine/carnitine-CoA ligase